MATRLSRRNWLFVSLCLLIILPVLAGFAALWWFDSLPDRVDEQQTIVVGQTRLVPDSDASLRVVVQDLVAGRPIPDAYVRVSLDPADGDTIPLFEGRTDETGSLPVSFHVPPDLPAEAQLVVETRSEVGRDRVEQPVTIQRDYRLLLTTDKPLYQPGQTIHMRALALSTYDLSPAQGEAVEFLVEDPKGNKVFCQSVTTSDWGVAAADFVLADLVNQGNYKLVVSLGNSSAERTVEVRPYVLPKFGVSISTDRSFYLPGERVEGVIQADYFFGKPVAGGEVRIVGSVWDVERVVAVDIQGQTDEEGAYPFEFDLPPYFAGSGLESGQAQFALEVTVVDQTNHAEQTSMVIPVAAQPLVIEAVAESGLLKPGVENIVYILTSYPDGRPAPTTLQVSVGTGSPVEIESGEFGLAQFSFTPVGEGSFTLDVRARDEAGLEAQRQILIETEYGFDSVLLRTDRATYTVGETMHLLVLTSFDAGSIYLDIVRAGQTLSTRSAPVEDGRAEFVVDLSPDLYGTLELHAYKVLLDGSIVRDTRLVVVDAPTDIGISLTADNDTYLPGETAQIEVQTSGVDGAGVQTVLGLAVVDESVFALQQQDPGFAKLYFMLQQELMEPFYQIKGLEPPDEEQVLTAQDDALRAAWAGVPSTVSFFPINSHQEKIAAVEKAQQEGFGQVGLASILGMIIIPLALWGVVIAAMRQSGVVRRSLGRAALLLLLLALLSVLTYFWLAQFAYFYVLEVPFFLLLIALGVVLLLFTFYAWLKGDRSARLLSLITLAWPALFFLLFRAVDRGGEPPEELALGAALALFLVPLAYLLFGQTRWAQGRRFAGGVATGLAVLLLLPVLFILAALVPVQGAVFTDTAAGLGPPVMEERGLLMGTAMPTPAALPMPMEDTQAAGVAEPPRLRQWFPETLYWAPAVLTDESGFVSLEIPLADSITTWRLTALASSQDGRLGFATHPIRVFQDFFVDIDLPVALTQGDEISIPVGVFNYLPESQEVRLVVEEEEWFELLGEGEQVLTIPPNEVDVVYFPIRVLRFGRQGFQVTAWGDVMSDAIRREVTVLPNGQEVRLTESAWLRKSVEVGVPIPLEAIPDTPRLEVKIYPGAMAQVVEGLEKILRLPHG